MNCQVSHKHIQYLFIHSVNHLIVYAIIDLFIHVHTFLLIKSFIYSVILLSLRKWTLYEWTDECIIRFNCCYIHPFIYLFIYPIIELFIHALTSLLIYSFIHSLIHLLIHRYKNEHWMNERMNVPTVSAFIYLYIYPINILFIHALTSLLIYLFIYSFIHPVFIFITDECITCSYIYLYSHCSIIYLITQSFIHKYKNELLNEWQKLRKLQEDTNAK